MRLFDIDSREDYLQKINSQGGSLVGRITIMVGAKRRSRTEESQNGD